MAGFFNAVYLQTVEKQKISGIILAGGRGIRLGRNKGLALLNGRPLIEYVIENLSEICDEILINSNTQQCKHYGYQIVPDIHLRKGPMSGVHAGLKASSNRHLFVVSVDTPFVGPEFIRFMLKNKGESLAAAPWFGKDHYEPLCAYYHKDALPVIESFFAKGNYKLPDVFRALPFTPVPILKEQAFYHDMLFHNINTEEDLIKAENYLRDGKQA